MKNISVEVLLRTEYNLRLDGVAEMYIESYTVDYIDCFRFVVSLLHRGTPPPKDVIVREGSLV